MSNRDLHGMLADTNVQRHQQYVRALLEKQQLWPILTELRIEFLTFGEVGVSTDLDDRALWKLCQENGWLLFTDNRNRDGPDSLQATLDECWQTGDLPILTPANKAKFERDSSYAAQVAQEIAELLFGISDGQFRDQQRIYVPR